MNFSESILLAIFDKLLIGVLVLMVAYWLNRRLESLKSSLSFREALAPNRTAAYQALWEKTEPLTPREDSELDLDLKAAKSLYFERLRTWYYKQGNAMYLSLDATDLFLRGLNLLEREEVSPKRIRKHFSSLRTQLKVDLGVYSRADAKIRIPRSG